MSTSDRWISVRHSKLDTEEYDLDTFLGLLYDDMESKVQATYMIFSMSLHIDNLGAIATHTSAMGALVRVLREEGRKSIQLRLNTVSTFLIFSFFQNFHQVLIDNQIGRTALNLLDLENLRTPNVSIKTLKAQVVGASNESEEKLFSSTNLSMNKSLHDQDKVLYASVYLLYNIAVNIQIERKMRKCNLVESLCAILNRTNGLLLVITISFLRRLSAYKENLAVIKENAVTFKLLHMLHFNDESLSYATLQLLLNLSFDRGFREDMVHCGCLQIFDALIEEQKFTNLISCLLYNLSRDLDLRYKILESNILSNLLEKIICEEEDNLSQELNALIVNLTCVSKTAMLNLDVVVCEKFILYVVQTNNVLLFKTVKNLSSIENTGIQWATFLPALVESLLQSESSIQVEVMGTLNNLTYLEALHDSLLLNSGLLHYLSTELHASNQEDDINLQIIIFIGGVCSDVSAPKLSQVGIVSTVCDVFMQRLTDTDIILQCMYAMIRFLAFDSTREAFLEIFEQAATFILELSQDANKLIMTMADDLIDMIYAMDQSLACHIRRTKFDMYNEGWSEKHEVLVGF